MNNLDLDPIDLQLLEFLQNDSSRSNLDLAALVGVSPPTCLRRVKRLHELGLIEKEMAVLSVDRLSAALGHGLCAVVEITLDRQDSAALEAFEALVCQDAEVQQCYRVSPGPDFCLVVHTAHMPAYLALVQRLFTTQANVRNVKTFFSLKRSKFGARVALGQQG